MMIPSSLQDDRITRLARAVVSIACLIGFVSTLFSFGCTPKSSSQKDRSRLQIVWGRRGIDDGLLQKSRAMTIDQKDQLYIVDVMGRVQVFDTNGKYLRGWKTPAIEFGKPTGLGIDRSGLIMVADTHYYRVLFYTADGVLQESKTIGSPTGQSNGEFGWVTDAVQDSQGNYYISEYGEFDRIQKFTQDGKLICRFGRQGREPLEFNRPQSMALDSLDQLWIADAHNHRIQVVRCQNDQPELIKIIGEHGPGPGQFNYPYDLLFNRDGDLIVCEKGNNRIQKLSLNGDSIDIWGSPGLLKGQLNQPWSIVEDSQGRTHILDTLNFRIQRIAFR